MMCQSVANMIPPKNCTQDFLNDGQYQRNGILRYEKVFGKTYVSTGGETTTKVSHLIERAGSSGNENFGLGNQETGTRVRPIVNNLFLN